MNMIKSICNNKFKSFLGISGSMLLFVAVLSSTILFTGCGKKARTLNPDEYITDPPSSDTAGYYYPAVLSHYPTTSNITSSTKIVIIFNMSIYSSDLNSEIAVYFNSVQQTPGTDYTLTCVSPYKSVAITLLTASAGDVVAVHVGTGIHNLANTVSMDTAYDTTTYTIITDPATGDSTAPYISGAITPVSGATGVSRNLGSISVIFSEDIDFSTVNSSTFNLTDTTNTISIPSTYYYNTATKTLYLYPTVTLEALATHTVVMTTGIKDLSGVSFAGTSWFFTTAAASATSPGMEGPTVVSIGKDNFVLSWSTDEITTYEIFAGRNDSPASFDTSGTSYPGDYTSSVTYTLSSLTQGQRYWYYVTCTDYDGNSVSSSVAELNLFTPETPIALHSDPQYQKQVRTMDYFNPLYQVAGRGSGVAVFWESQGTYKEIYGQLFDYTGVEEWGSGTPVGILTGADFTYVSSLNDGIGGVIVLASNSGGNIVARRVNESGAEVWGTTSGFTIGTGTAAGAAVVYSGIFSILTSTSPRPQVDMGARLSLSSPFFEDLNVGGSGNTLSDDVVDNDILYNLDTNSSTRLIKTPGTWDHEYILGQNTAIYLVSDSYTLADGTETVSSPVAVTNHIMHVLGSLAEDDQTFYLPHTFTDTVNVGDIVSINGSYARVDTVNTISMTQLDSGGETQRDLSRLYDVNGGFTSMGSLSANDMVHDMTNDVYAVVTSIADSSRLMLGADIFTAIELYEFYNLTLSGTISSGGTGTIYSAAGGFSACSDGDLIIVVSGSTISLGPYTITVVDDNNITISSGDYSTYAGETFRIYSQTAFGTSGARADNGTNLFIDSSATWVTTGVVAGDLVRNTSASTYSYVSEVSETMIKTSGALFAGVLGSLQNYQIYHEFCTTHGYTEQVESFYEITLDSTITMAAGDNVYFYSQKLSWTADATSGTFPTNPLYDDDVTLSGLGISAGSTGDIVFNYTTTGIAYIDTSTYTVHAYALSMNSNIFTADNNEYMILSPNWDYTYYTDITKYGIAAAGTSGYLTGTGFGLVTSPEGAVAYNATDDTYSLITYDDSSTTQLLLSWDCFVSGDRYLVSDRSGVLVVRQNGTTIWGKVISLNTVGSETDPVDLVADTNLGSGTNPYVIPDGKGNAYVVYVNAGNLIIINYYDGTLTSIWSNLQADTSTSSQAIVDVRSDSYDGVIILYTSGGNTALKAQRIRPSGVYWTTGGRAVVSVATSKQAMAIDLSTMNESTPDASNDTLIVAWVQSSMVYSMKVSGNSSSAIQLSSGPSGTPAGIQSNPSVYINAAGDKAFVVWDDSKFYNTISGYGVFGIKLNVTGSSPYLDKDTSWYANDGLGTDDIYGVAILLNNFNLNREMAVLAPYDNNAGVLMFWVDWEITANNGDLLYMKPLSYTGGYLPAW